MFILIYIYISSKVSVLYPPYKNKRPAGLNGHLTIRDSTLTSHQKSSYICISTANKNQQWHGEAAKYNSSIQ